MSYHISKKGEIEVCNANIRACPLGGLHFASKDDAEKHLQSAYGVLSNDTYWRDIETYQRRRVGPTYYKKIRSIELYTKDIQKDVDSIHVAQSRRGRQADIRRTLGEGKVVGVFKLNDGRKKDQIHEIYDNGVVCVYDVDTHKLVTEYVSHYLRLEDVYDRAKMYPPDGLIEKARDNTNKGYNDL